MNRSAANDDLTIGIGAALSEARRIHGLGIDEAARATKLRSEQLAAIEAEDFDAVGSDAVIRGVLRTYAIYLGIRPEKVLAAYDEHGGVPPAAKLPSPRTRTQRIVHASRIRDDQRLLLMVAVGVVILLVIFGLVSRRHAAPPTPPAIATVVPASPGPGITAVISARRTTELTVAVDGAETGHTMQRGETISFKATGTLEVWATDGGAISVQVGQHDLGIPGEDGQAWHGSFEAPTPAPVSPTVGVGEP
jgi:cytoskeleton protein RodZ